MGTPMTPPQAHRALVVARWGAAFGVALLMIGALQPWADIRSVSEGYYDKGYATDMFPVAALIACGALLCSARLVRGPHRGRGLGLAGIVVGWLGVLLLWMWIPVWNASLSDERVIAESGIALVSFGFAAVTVAVWAAATLERAAQRVDASTPAP